jgi:hypothetical protein
LLLLNIYGKSLFAWVLSCLSRFFEVFGELWVKLVGKLGIACKFIRHGIRIFCIGLRIRGIMKNGGVKFSVIISRLMTNEATEVGAKLSPEGANRVDRQIDALLIHEKIFACIDIEPK